MNRTNSMDSYRKLTGGMDALAPKVLSGLSAFFKFAASSWRTNGRVAGLNVVNLAHDRLFDCG